MINQETRVLREVSQPLTKRRRIRKIESSNTRTPHPHHPPTQGQVSHSHQFLVFPQFLIGVLGQLTMLQCLLQLLALHTLLQLLVDVAAALEPARIKQRCGRDA